MINFSTGPVMVEKSVLEALSSVPISHRTKQFLELHVGLTEKICRALSVKETFILQGSGTLANEVLIWQIKTLNSFGMILSNGEFGNRLIDQANRIGLNFLVQQELWGTPFNLDKIESLIISHKLKWLLFAHCETSTGMNNPLDNLLDLAEKHGCKVFVDCMSTVGTGVVDLSRVSMATGSSGKALGSISGIALVFSNLVVAKDKAIPKYLDLYFYKSRNGIPFTVSSNQLHALSIAVEKTLDANYRSNLVHYSRTIYEALNPLNIIPFSNIDSKIFTLVTKRNTQEVCSNLSHSEIQLSYQSEYLLERNWMQLALFGHYTIKGLEQAIHSLLVELQD